MQLSLSVRIAEGFLSKEDATLSLSEVVNIAGNSGYDAICMRGSQVGVHSSHAAIANAAETLANSELAVSMVTGNFDIVYNNEKGPECLRHITPFLKLAKSLGAKMIRVALKHEEDIAFAQQAADLAADIDLLLVHQCHTLSLFETVDSIEATLRKIDRPNFGLVYEPANLEICGEPYGCETIQRLRKWIFNVYLQNQVLKSDGAITLPTWCRGPVSFDLQPVHEPGGVDFAAVVSGLRDVGYEGYVTVHQSSPEGEAPETSARKTAQFLRALISR